MQFAVVTGATQGIGKAIAYKLLSQGWSVALCARSADKLHALQQQWSAMFPAAKVIAFPADLAQKNQADSLAVFVLQQFGKVDVLVNNAGSFQPGDICTEPDDRLPGMIGVNLYSAYYLTRALAPAMKQAGSGHIFNMCSVASLKAYPNGGSYSISKYALLGFSENLREELKPFNIKVTSVCPGATWTPSWQGSGVEEERIMDVADIADMVWAATSLSPRANVENIVLRPVKGDL